MNSIRRIRLHHHWCMFHLFICSDFVEKKRCVKGLIVCLFFEFAETVQLIDWKYDSFRCLTVIYSTGRTGLCLHRDEIWKSRCKPNWWKVRASGLSLVVPLIQDSALIWPFYISRKNIRRDFTTCKPAMALQMSGSVLRRCYFFSAQCWKNNSAGGHSLTFKCWKNAMTYMSLRNFHLQPRHMQTTSPTPLRALQDNHNCVAKLPKVKAQLLRREGREHLASTI